MSEVAVDVNVEARVVMLAGKRASPEKHTEARVGVATRDVDAVSPLPVGLPLHRESVRSAFTGDANGAGKAARPEFGEADQADAGDREALRRVDAKRVGHDATRDVGIDTEVDE